MCICVFCVMYMCSYILEKGLEKYKYKTVNRINLVAELKQKGDLLFFIFFLLIILYTWIFFRYNFYN